MTARPRPVLQRRHAGALLTGLVIAALTAAAQSYPHRGTRVTAADEIDVTAASIWPPTTRDPSAREIVDYRSRMVTEPADLGTASIVPSGRRGRRGPQGDPGQHHTYPRTHARCTDYSCCGGPCRPNPSCP